MKSKKVNLLDNKYLIFNKGVIIFNDILFLHQRKSGQQRFEYLIGNKTLSVEMINIFKSNIKENNRIRQKYDFKYKHVIFPSKEIAYSDEFKKIGIAIQPITPDECLKDDSVYYCEVDKTHYHKDDTHTNAFSTIALLNKVCTDFNLTPLPEAIYKEEIISGDLGIMCNNAPQKRLVFDKFIINNQLKDNKRRKQYIQHYSLKKFCSGNSGHLDFIINPLSIYNKRIILFGDSFFYLHREIYSTLFNEVIYIRNPYIQEDIIKSLKPDIVLTGNAERYFINMPDALNPKPYFLNYLKPSFKSIDIDTKTINGFNILFSGRESKEYKSFKKDLTINVNIKNKLDNHHIYELSIEDLISTMDINICRDKALEFESSDIKKAYHLMKLAHYAKPEGSSIKAKFLAYSKKISK